MAESALKKKENGRGTRATDAEETRFNILEVATAEFADKGLSGARIDEIAERTNSSKRMIYYYFGSKEGLYRAVLERAYTAVREVDADNRRDDLDPDAALRDVVGVTFDYHNQHPEFVRLVMNENILRGAHVGEVPGIRERNRKVIDQLRAILARGVASELKDFSAEVLTNGSHIDRSTGADACSVAAVAQIAAHAADRELQAGLS